MLGLQLMKLGWGGPNSPHNHVHVCIGVCVRVCVVNRDTSDSSQKCAYCLDNSTLKAPTISSFANRADLRQVFTHLLTGAEGQV